MNCLKSLIRLPMSSLGQMKYILLLLSSIFTSVGICQSPANLISTSGTTAAAIVTNCGKLAMMIGVFIPSMQVFEQQNLFKLKVE